MNNFLCFHIKTDGPVFYRFMKNPIWTLNKQLQLYELACPHDNAKNQSPLNDLLLKHCIPFCI